MVGNCKVKCRNLDHSAPLSLVAGRRYSVPFSGWSNPRTGFPFETGALGGPLPGFSTCAPLWYCLIHVPGVPLSGHPVLTPVFRWLAGVFLCHRIWLSFHAGTRDPLSYGLECLLNRSERVTQIRTKENPRRSGFLSLDAGLSLNPSHPSHTPVTFLRFPTVTFLRWHVVFSDSRAIV